MANTPVINSFNAGELSPYLYGRNDLKKYNSGCLVMENFQALPYGGAVRRPAIKFVASSKAGGKIRLVEFQFSSEQTYILEFGDKYIRFYKDGAQVVLSYSAWQTGTAYAIGALKTNGGNYYRCLVAHTSGTFATDLAANKWVLSGGATDTAYEIVTPYAIADIYDIRYIQSADVMFLVHKDYMVRRLSRFADTNWTIAEEVHIFPVMREQNITATTLAVSATTGTSKTLTASAALFNANHVGSYWQLKHVKPTIAVTTTNATPAASLPTPTGTNTIKVNAGEKVSLYTRGTWTVSDLPILAIWRSDDAGTTWEQYRYYQMADRNVDASWTEDKDDILYCVTHTTTSAGTFALTVQEAYTTGLVKVTAFTSATSVTVDVVRDVGATTATKRWSEGAWSTYRGFPACVSLWESRLIYANNLSQPNTMWLSRIDDYTNFNFTMLDDSAMNVTIGSGLLDEIRWMVPHRALIIGTTGSEWALEAESDNKPVTPSSYALRRKTTYGSTSKIQGVMVNSAVLFVMRQGRKVREFVYNVDAQDYVAPDLTILAEHITEGGIVDAAYQQQPDNNLLCIRADGTMIPMTYERDQDVTGWQRWNNSAFVFESVAVLPRDEDEDQIWVSCKLTVDSVVKRYIGIFDNREWGTSVKDEWSGSDFYKVFADPSTTTIDGLDYLEGKTVTVLRDGMVEVSKVVTDGEITTAKVGARIVIGLPYTSTLAPMYVEPQSQFVQPVGKVKALFKAVLRFKDTLSCKVGQTLQRLENVDFRKDTDGLDKQVELFSGEKKVNITNRYELLHTCYIVQDKPLPITVIAMVPWCEVHGE